MGMKPIWRDNSSMIETPLSQNLTREMERAGQSQHSLALAAGLKPDVIRDILRGKTRFPSGDKLAKISRVLNLTADQLLGYAPILTNAGTTQLEQRGQLVNDIAELTLLAFWRSLDDGERRFMLSLVRNGALAK